MTISWITDTKVISVVELSQTSPTKGPVIKVTGTAEASQYAFQSAYKKDPYTSGWIHHVTVMGLDNDATYSYNCGSDKKSSAGPFTFTTPPAVGPDASFKIAIMGDMGQTSNSDATMHHILDGGPYLATLLVGDLSYADSAWQPFPPDFNPCDQARWDSWGKMVEPLAANMPLMVLPGNHEVEQEGAPPATQTKFLAYESRMHMPSVSSGGQGSQFYSFNVGSMHVVMLSSYIDYNQTSAQYKWLAADLQGVDRTKTPWVVAAMHAPWYNSNMKHHDEVQETGMKEAMEPIFVANKVDIVFAGHVHAYERCYAVANNVTTPGAPVHINIGDAGNREGPCPDYYVQPEWSAFREAKFGHGELEVFNSTHMGWRWHRIIDDESVHADSVMLVKSGGATGVVAAVARTPTSAVQHDGMAHLLKEGQSRQLISSRKTIKTKAQHEL
jgi:hypothetical protein